jgi:tripartite-type tricarboxylate transporter receptor subunit TctC
LQDPKLKVLGMTSAKRSALMPQLPAVAEALPGFESTTWFGLYGPKGLPAEVLVRLSGALNTALQDSELRQRLLRLGAEPASLSTPETFARMVESDSAKWGQLIAARRITAE